MAWRRLLTHITIRVRFSGYDRIGFINLKRKETISDLWGRVQSLCQSVDLLRKRESLKYRSSTIAFDYTILDSTSKTLKDYGINDDDLIYFCDPGSFEVYAKDKSSSEMYTLNVRCDDTIKELKKKIQEVAWDERPDLHVYAVNNGVEEELFDGLFLVECDIVNIAKMVNEGDDFEKADDLLNPPSFPRVVNISYKWD